MGPEARTPERIKAHYEIEKQLAQRLFNSTREERRTLYTSLYDELFLRVPDHPLLTKKLSPEESAQEIAYEFRYIQPFLKKDTVYLEIGPGDCALAFKVAEFVKTVYAVDVSEEITKSSTYPDNFKLILTDGTSIPVPENSVGFAYSNQLMEHLHPDDALEQLHNLSKALMPGGVYICITPNRLNGPHDVSMYFDEVATGFHLKEYTVTELERLFRAVNFSKVRVFVPIKGIRIFLPVFPVKLCEKILSLLPYRLRKFLASTWLIDKLLGIRLVGIK